MVDMYIYLIFNRMIDWFECVFHCVSQVRGLGHPSPPVFEVFDARTLRSFFGAA